MRSMCWRESYAKTAIASQFKTNPSKYSLHFWSIRGTSWPVRICGSGFGRTAFQARSEREYVSTKSLILLYAALGERDQVIHLLEKAYQNREPQLFFIGSKSVRVLGPLSELIRDWTRERLPHL